MDVKTLHDVSDALRKTLGFLSGMGVRGFDCSTESLSTIKEWGKPRKAPAPSVAKPMPDAVQDSLEAIRSDLGECMRCHLGGRRINLVFGDGSPDARLMFIGEAPGYEEDKMGLPFVGASGQLLTRMIESMGLSRNDVYIANILKCRPTENRNPLPEEINACYPILERQISTIAPEVICTLGSFATQAILGDSRGITRLRGRFHEYRGIKVMPTFHPAYLLRNPASKREAWEDLKKIMALLGLKRPEPARG